MVSFMADGKTVSVFPAEDDCRPLVCLHTFGREGEDVYQILREAGQPDFSLVAVSGLDWNHDMAPWDIPPLSEKDRPCTGGAEDYLKLLTGKILPEAEKAVKGQPSWRGIAGYSLRACSPYTPCTGSTGFPVPPACPALSGFLDSGITFLPMNPCGSRTACIFPWETESTGRGTVS